MTDDRIKGALSGFAEVVGLNKAAVQRAFEDVKANRDLLDSCLRHDFEPIKGPGVILARKAKCSKCGGTLDIAQARWYQQGLDHAMRHSLPEFKEKSTEE